MENADPQGVQGGVILNKNKKTQDHAGGLEAQGHHQHGLDQTDHALEAVHVQGLFNQKPAPDADLPACGQNQSHADRGDAQTADLDQGCHNSLAKNSEVIRRVDGNQAGDAYGAGRSKQCVNKGDLRVRPHRDGKQKQQTAQKDDRCKSQGNQPAGRLLFQKLNHGLSFRADWGMRRKGRNPVPAPGF